VPTWLFSQLYIFTPLMRIRTEMMGKRSLYKRASSGCEKSRPDSTILKKCS
jgi:hypothetical protein